MLFHFNKRLFHFNKMLFHFITPLLLTQYIMHNVFDWIKTFPDYSAKPHYIKDQ